MPRYSFLVGFSASLLITMPAMAGPVTVDFDDGGDDGFTTDASGFSLANPGSGGNPNGYILLTDLAQAGPGGFVNAPSQFLGDLTDFISINWDSLRPDNASLPSAVLLVGPGGAFAFDGGGSKGSWDSNSAPLNDASGWKQFNGSGTLADSVADVTRLAFLLEVVEGLGKEAGLDNVRLVPGVGNGGGDGGNGGSNGGGNGGSGGSVIPLPPALPATLVGLVPFLFGAAAKRLRRR
jgi:hypothetical protein